MVSNRLFLAFRCSSQWAAKAIEHTLSKVEKAGHRSILTAVIGAVDPETGEKMTFEETVIVSAGFMYPFILFFLTSVMLLLTPLQRL